MPEARRSLVAAALLQAQFDRSAYGCRLYCCWCAQDLKANAFWEAMGFTPIAFRTGSRTKGKGTDGKSTPRIHLFWQKRVRAGDVTTPWWYPAKTEGGEMREDRLVFPIPPGVHWRDVLPVVLPEGEAAGGEWLVASGEETGLVRASSSKPGATVCGTPQAVFGDEDTALGTRPWHPAPATSSPSAMSHQPPALRPARVKKPKAPPVPVRPPGVHKGGFWFAVPLDQQDAVPTPEQIAADQAAEKAEAAAARAAAAAQRKAQRKALTKVDPRFIAMARELRDRWTEQADAIVALPGKHDVRRAIAATTTTMMATTMATTMMTATPPLALPSNGAPPALPALPDAA